MYVCMIYDEIMKQLSCKQCMLCFVFWIRSIYKYTHGWYNMLSCFVLCGITCFEITRGLLAICYSSKQTILSVSNQWFPDRVYNKIIVSSTVGLIFQLSNDVCQLKDVQLFSICSSCFFFLSSFFCFGFLRLLLLCLHVVSSCSCSLFFFFLCSCVLSFAFFFVWLLIMATTVLLLVIMLLVSTC